MWFTKQDWNWINWTTVGVLIVLGVFVLLSFIYIFWYIKNPHKELSPFLKEQLFKNKPTKPDKKDVKNEPTK